MFSFLEKRNKSVLRRLWDWVWPITFSDFLMVGLTFWIAAGTLASAVAIWYQWHEMHMGGEQTDRIIAADERLAKAMEQSSSTAQAAFAETTHLSELAQRAWLDLAVGPSLPNQRLEPDQGYPVRVSITNVGKSPALQLRHASYWVFADAYGEHHDEFKIRGNLHSVKDFVRDGMLVPGGSFHFDIVFRISKDYFEELRTQKNRLVVLGRIEYEDAFGTPHWNDYCYFLLNGGEFSECPQYNRVDNNQSPKLVGNN